MVLVIFKILGRFILRGALPLAIVVDDQVARQAHQPVLQVSLFWIVLIERSIDAYEDFLS